MLFMALRISKKPIRFSRCCKKLWSSLSKSSQLLNSDVRLKRNQYFDEECARQTALITRVEKIQVSVKGPPQECTLIMNKMLSTPYNCAMHINETAKNMSVFALVNGKPWDMHRPLEDDCELTFHHFLQEDPRLTNKIYWRSCSFLLGRVVEKAFKDEFYVELHSWPSPNVRSGSFVYDVDLKMANWTPSKEELRVLSVLARKEVSESLKFERLEVDASLALKLFADNRFKREQIPRIAAISPTGNTLTLYRVGDHIDISRGPMIANTNFVGRLDVTAAYPMKTDYGILHRFQGVSLPHQILINAFAYSIIVDRASKVNPARIPQNLSSEKDLFETPLHNTSQSESSVASGTQ